MPTEKQPPMERMARVIGHEVRNPLAVINNSVYFVKTKLGGSVDPKVGKHLGIIEAEVQRANGLIAEMLAFARPVEAQGLESPVRELIDAALKAAPRPAGVQVRVEVSPPDLKVRADPEPAGGAVRRLLDNAFDAAGEKGTISVTASARGSAVEILVTDSGPGLSPEARAQLFEPFASTKPKGLGLGLATAKKFAEAFKGSLELVTDAKGGAFRLRFPRA